MLKKQAFFLFCTRVDEWLIGYELWGIMDVELRIVGKSGDNLAEN